jgi:hypothetical protein
MLVERCVLVRLQGARPRRVAAERRRQAAARAARRCLPAGALEGSRQLRGCWRVLLVYVLPLLLPPPLLLLQPGGALQGLRRRLLHRHAMWLRCLLPPADGVPDTICAWQLPLYNPQPVHCCCCCCTPVRLVLQVCADAKPTSAVEHSSRVACAFAASHAGRPLAGLLHLPTCGDEIWSSKWAQTCFFFYDRFSTTAFLSTSQTTMVNVTRLNRSCRDVERCEGSATLMPLTCCVC